VLLSLRPTNQRCSSACVNPQRNATLAANRRFLIFSLDKKNTIDIAITIIIVIIILII
jgi:hypothetical protein